MSNVGVCAEKSLNRDRSADEVFACEGYSVRLTSGNQILLKTPSGAVRWPTSVDPQGRVRFDGRTCKVPDAINTRIVQLLERKEVAAQYEEADELCEPPADVLIECEELGLADESSRDTNWCQNDDETESDNTPGSVLLDASYLEFRSGVSGIPLQNN
jgi:hypothetical protein